MSTESSRSFHASVCAANKGQWRKATRRVLSGFLALIGKEAEILDIASRGDDSKLAILLAKGADPNAFSDQYGGTALTRAGSSGHAKIVQLLLNAGCDPDSTDHSGNSALMLAVRFGHLECAKLLLDHVCRADLRNHEGDTASILAANSGNQRVLFEILKSGCALSDSNSHCYFPREKRIMIGFDSAVLHERSFRSVEGNSECIAMIDAEIAGREISFSAKTPSSAKTAAKSL